MKTLRPGSVLSRLAVLALLPLGSMAVHAQASRVTAQMRPPVLAADTTDLGPVPAAQPMVVTVHLSPSATQTAALQKFLVDVETAGSASYHQWLTPAQFGQSFGPTANQVAAVQAFAAANGMTASVAASPSGMRLMLSGTAAQVESALAPSIHAYRQGSVAFFANTAAPSLPAAIAAQVLAIDGLSTAPSAHPMTLLTDGVATTADDSLAALTTAVEHNASRVVALSNDSCVEDFDVATQTAVQLVLREAAAQGMTVLAASGCGSRGSAGFPSALSEATAVAVAPGIKPAVDATLTELRPGWQQAVGLPSDAFRHEPDVTVSSLAALAQTMQTILAREPVNADGSAARLGNVAGTLYGIATEPGLYTQPDGAAAGTWEAATGLGVVDLARLAKAYPDGASQNNVQLVIGNPGAVHGQNVTFTANVTNNSGNNALPAPTGTITFVTNTGVTVGTGALVNGSFTANYNQLPANANYTVVAQYTGDANYAAGNSVTDPFSVTPEASILNAAAVGSVPVGGMITVNVSDASGSGVGTPSGQATVTPQYIQTPPTYTGTLSGSGGTATATVKVPATLAGNVALKVNCVSADPSFTCYVPININATVTLGTTTTALSVSPATVVTNQPVTFTATVTGAGAGFPEPTGNVEFFDYATQVGSGQVNANGVATLTVSNLDGSITHNFTATYMGDSNYSYSNATNGGSTGGGSKTTSGTLNVSPNPPVNGTTTTLTDTITYTNNGTAPTGTVTFYEDNASIGTGAVNGGVATFTSTTISGTHSFYAVYAGDANYTGDTSNTYTTGTGTSTTTTTVVANPTAVASGGTTTLTATVTPASTINGIAPSGNVTFTSSLQGVLGVAGLNGTTATLSPTLTTAGAQSITATYNGDSRYTTSTSATPANVTVGPTTAIVVTATPASIGYGAIETIASTVTATTNNGVGPSGQLNFTIYGTVQSSASEQLTPTSTTTSTGTTTITSPTPGSYDVQTACTGYNFTCANVQVAQAQFTVVKANTTTTLSSNPAIPVAGQSATFTAVVANANTSASSSAAAPTGTVTFYAGSSTGTSVPVAGGQATFTTTLSATTGTTVTAVYSGDANYNSSNSSSTVTVAPVNTSGGLTTSATTGLAGSVVVLTATFTSTASTTNPTPAAPGGTVTFYDVYNGQTVSLGSATLAATGATISAAQLSTTGLKVGSHSITAVLATSTNFIGSTSNVITVSLSDFSLAFSPTSLTVTRGVSGSATVTITALNGFTGTVSLGCTPPSGTATTCGFTPSTITGSGVAQLIITTTQPAVKSSGPHAELQRAATGVTLAALLFGFLLPGAKRRRPMLLALLLSLGLFGTLGCTNLINPSVSGTSTPGTPLGTETFTITASGTDGKTTVNHNTQFQVTVNQ